MLELIIFHVDANSAYLSWTATALLEEGYETDIRNIPAVIAGDPANRHGIVLTKSIPAKAYGIRTGESLMEARRKCPQLKVFPPDYDLYLLCSEAMYGILCEYTPVIQRFSVDECFCDMSSVREAVDNPVRLAVEIKERIKSELGFTVNIGIGRNKLCAKMAGELKKPDMVHTLWPCEIPVKMWPLPAGELFMVGRASEKKLAAMGINTIGELAGTDRILLKTIMKSHGLLIHDYANGIDDSPVIINDNIVRKGIGNGLTYAYDLETRDDIYKELLALCERVSARLRKLGMHAGLIAVHLRNSELAGYSHQVKLGGMINTTNEIFERASGLIDEMWKGEPVRAMSVSLRELSRDDNLQLSLFDSGDRARDEALDKAVDRIRDAFGVRSIFRGTFANGDINPVQGGVNDGNYIMMGGYKQ
ncbi:MAG: DNA polymerase IV [Clostridiales bacterium]|nr:DNA polymerase IV [Clostridiales bacterium]